MEIELYHQFLLSVARSPTIIQYIFLYSTISTFRTGHSTHTNNEHQTTEGNRPQRLQAGLEEEGGEGQFSHSQVGHGQHSLYTLSNSLTHTLYLHTFYKKYLHTSKHYLHIIYSTHFQTLSTHFQTLSTHYLHTSKHYLHTI